VAATRSKSFWWITLTLGVITSVLLVQLVMYWVQRATNGAGPVHETKAVVVDISPGNGRWTGGSVRVTFRSNDGILGSRMVHLTDLRCKVGDVIPAEAQGILLTIDSRPCG
jgi:hypothetical protein